MNMKSKICLFCFLFLILFTANLPAQEKPDKNIAQNTCDADFARTLVEGQVAESKSIEDSEKRIKISVRAADFLWKFDEPSARKYLIDAYDFADDRYNEWGFERKKIGTFKGEDLTFAKPDLRFAVIEAIAKKDRAWANRLIEKVLKNYEKDRENRKDSINNVAEVASVMKIAFDTIKTNPNLSLQLYRRAMQYPLDRHWFWTFYSIHRQDKNFADNLYREVLNNYQNAPPSKLLFLSAYPFGRGRFFGADRFTFNIGVPKDFAAERNLQMQFLNVFFNRINSFADNPNELNKPAEKDKLAEIAYIVSALREIEPIILKDFPDLFGKFNAVKSKANALMTQEIAKNLDEKEAEYDKNTEDFAAKLKRAEKSDEKGTLTDQENINLILSARTEEDYKQAETWLDKIENENARRDVSGYFFYQRSELAVREMRLDDAEKFGEKISDIEQKAVISFKIAEAKLKSGNAKNEAERILLEVSKLVGKMKPSIEKARLLLGLANSFEDINHSYALDELRDAVAVINKLNEPDIFSTFISHKVSGSGYEFLYAIIFPGYDFEETFQKISKKDFGLSLAHSNALSDKYLKTLAILAIADNCLKNSAKK